MTAPDSDTDGNEDGRTLLKIALGFVAFLIAGGVFDYLVAEALAAPIPTPAPRETVREREGRAAVRIGPDGTVQRMERDACGCWRWVAAHGGGRR